jgi:hypothetical protein
VRKRLGPHARAVALAVAWTVAWAAGLSSCAAAGFVDSRDRGQWKDGAGAFAEWSPKRPAIGDLVRLEASLPSAKGMELKLPGGESPDPTDTLYRGDGGVTLRWSFRAKAAGDYCLGATPLWSVASVAGQAADLKTRDPDELWSGKPSLPAKPSVAPGSPTEGAPGSATPGAAGSGAAAVPQANT